MNKTKTMSLRNVFILIFTAMLAVMIVLFIIANSYISDVLYERSADINLRLLRTHVDILDEKIRVSNQFLYNFIANNQDILALETTAKADEIFFATKNVKATMAQTLSYNSLLNGMIYFSPKNAHKDTISMSANEKSVQESADIEIYFIENIRNENLFTLKWQLHSIEGEQYLMRFLKNGDSYCCAWINTDTLYAYINRIIFDAQGLCYISNISGNIVSGDSLFRAAYMLDQTGVKTVESDNQIYYQLNAESQTGEYYIVLFTPEYEVLKDLWVIRDIFIAMLVIFILLMPIIIVLLKHFIYNPTTSLVRSMNIISEGNIDHRINAPSKITEFSVINNTFNHMMNDINRYIQEIHDLKIHIYEKQLHEQETRLQFLQVSIKTHFILNCINTIYYMAETEDYGLIQKFSLFLVDFFRYMSKDSNSLMPLSEELKYTKSYISIQQMCFPDCIEYEEQIDDSLLAQCIPPLLLHTFVENTIKYCVNNRRKTVLRIEINKDLIKDTPYMKIIIRDNGKGLSEKAIMTLNNLDSEIDPDEYTGTRNIRNRLQIIYNDRARVVYSNENGTVVKILIPLENKAWEE